MNKNTDKTTYCITRTDLLGWKQQLMDYILMGFQLQKDSNDEPFDAFNFIPQVD